MNKISRLTAILAAFLMFMPITAIAGISSSSISINFYSDKAEINAGDKVTFTVEINSSGYVNSLGSYPSQFEYYYKFHFGDNSIDLGGYTNKTKIVISHRYNTVGNYYVQVYIKNLKTNEDIEKWLNHTIKVYSDNKKPVAVISASKTTAKVGESITFDGSASYDSDGYITSYKWDFGDGHNVNGKESSHSYSSSGTYVVKLTVIDNDGRASTKTISIYIENEIGFSVLLFTDKTEINAGDEVTFTATVNDTGSYASSLSEDNSDYTRYYTYTFMWGDGNSNTYFSTEKTLTKGHTYKEDGNYYAKVKVSRQGYDGYSPLIKIVVKSKYPDFYVSLQASSNKAKTGESITFTAYIDEDHVSDLAVHTYKYIYRWDFGDGNHLLLQTDNTTSVVNHIYSSDGTYHVTVSVKNIGSEKIKSDTVTIVIEGNNLPPVADAGGPYTQSSRIVFFDGSGSYDPDGRIVKYTWDFGDGNTVSRRSPTIIHIYSARGTYRVTLKITDDKGAVGEDVVTVRINKNNDNGNESNKLTANISLEPKLKNGDVVIERGKSVRCILTISDGNKQNNNLITSILSFIARVLSVEKSTYTYTVYFGDHTAVGGFSNRNRIVIHHTYMKSGHYSVYAVVKDDNDRRVAKTNLVNVNVTTMDNDMAPVALTSVHVYRAIVGERVVFNGSKSYDPDGRIVKYIWYFGDGASSNGSITEHVYEYKGEYNVKLVVMDDRGKEGIGQETVIVEGETSVTNRYNGTLDQHQDIADAYYKYDREIEWPRPFQTFTPGQNFSRLVRIDLYLGKHTLFDSSVSSMAIDNVNKSNGSANICNPIYLYLDILTSNPEHPPTAIASSIFDQISVRDIPDNGGWVEFDFKKPVLLRPGNEYYITLGDTGGLVPLVRYVKWYYGENNPYKNGTAGADSKLPSNVDFCFRTYALKDDGITTRYAVLVGVGIDNAGIKAPYADWSARRLRDALLMDPEHWDSSHVSVLINESATKSNIISTLENDMEQMDGDDLLFFATSSHGTTYAINVYDNILTTADINKLLTKYQVSKVVISIDSCYSGSWIDKCKGDGRIIMTSVRADELSSLGGPDFGASPYCSLLAEALSGHWVRLGSGGHPHNRGSPIPDDEDADYNNDGYVTAEEAYEYIKINTAWDSVEHPQMWDGYPSSSNNIGELVMTELHK